ncbi:hypothetical protein [Streptomyces sp. NPDC127100]|uniref:hypothetical protein n=1 Tax=Streptomyces sp. NPDC127100 TaxID=3347138 RepID=UPI0036655BF3
MAGLALDVRNTVLGALTPWTVPQGTRARNLVVLGALIAGCVINGDTLTGVLRQATWLVVTVIVLIIVRAVEGVALQLMSRDRPGRTAGALRGTA